MLFDTLLEFNEIERSLFFKFVTGSPRLPIGGLSNLNPKLTIALRSDENDSLPTVMCCTNYFKLPKYSNKTILKEKLLIAIKEGQNSFDLT